MAQLPVRQSLANNHLSGSQHGPFWYASSDLVSTSAVSSLYR
ncbi:MAG TPA: hypothetical protein VKB38_00695 [Terracidiphilus sp.]|nr:hypothetical protein [Terracidiphilus sp.]